MKNDTIGQEIKKRRILAGMTQKELAESLGMGDTELHKKQKNKKMQAYQSCFVESK